MNRPKAAMAALIRPLVEPYCGDIDVTWFTSADEALTIAPGVEIGWFDMHDKVKMVEIISAATNLKWLNSIYAGVEAFPLEQLKAQGTLLTNGAGLNSAPIAEFAIMMMLSAAKRIDLIVDSQRQHQWLQSPPGTAEIADSKALIIGYGGIGQQIAEKLAGFNVNITAVRRSASDDPAIIGLDQWRDRLGEFDWIFLAAPATGETAHMIGAAELAAMKSSAWLINVARGSLIDQNALISALNDKSIGGAALDVVDPEPLPQDHPLWDAPNCLITMHLAGQAQQRMFPRAASRFAENLPRYLAGEPMIAQADLDRGY